MLKHLIDLRDFSYVVLKKQNGEAYAEKGYKFQVMAFCCVYNLTFVVIVVTIFRKLGGTLPAVMFVPYIFFFWYFLRKVSKVPIDKDMPLEKYKLLRKKVAFIVSLGVVLFIVVGYVVNTYIA